MAVTPQSERARWDGPRRKSLVTFPPPVYQDTQGLNP